MLALGAVAATAVAAHSWGLIDAPGWLEWAGWLERRRTLPQLERVLSFCDRAELGRAAQVNKAWRAALGPAARPAAWRGSAVRGFPRRRRARLWAAMLLRGERPSLSEARFQALVARGAASRWAEPIETDVRRNYGALGHGDAGEARRALTETLYVLSETFPRIGYCQGLDYVAAHLLRVLRADSPDGATLRPRAAAELLCRLVGEVGLGRLYEPGRDDLERLCARFGRMLEEHLPLVWLNLSHHGIVPEMYLVGWLRTLFVYVDALPEETVSRVWDLFIFDQEWEPLLHVALALLNLLDGRDHALSEGGLEAVMRALKAAPQAEADADMLLEVALSMG